MLALEWAERGVRVNALGPGYLVTDMTEGLRSRPHLNEMLIDSTPLGRLGAPDEVVGAALFLASEASSYVTGPDDLRRRRLDGAMIDFELTDRQRDLQARMAAFVRDEVLPLEDELR